MKTIESGGFPEAWPPKESREYDLYPTLEEERRLDRVIVELDLRRHLEGAGTSPKPGGSARRK